MLLHFFNPGYEAALLLEQPDYTPPANVQRMQRELAFLPLWYGEPGDYVWVEEAIDPDFPGLPDNFPARPTLLTPALWADPAFSLPPLQATPWGLSPQTIRFFRTLAAVEHRTLYIPEWKENYRTLIGRQTAAHCLEQMRQRTDYLLPQTPVFLCSVAEVENYLQAHPDIPFVLKMPYSSSGRGLLRVDHPLPAKEKEWLTGALRKQGTVSLEPRLRKEKDFALEFYITPEGKAEYKGLSVFLTEGWKTYGGNRLAPEERLTEEITRHSGTAAFHTLKEITRQVVEETFGGEYTGYLGVDMLLYTDAAGRCLIHPCVEINMRYTMGMLAIRLFERLIHPQATAHFRITYEKDAWQRHQQLLQSHPAQYADGRLLHGYLSLCPVNRDTQYRAFVLTEE